MVRVTKSGNQYRITIPSEIIKLTKWNDGTEIMFIPELKSSSEKLSGKAAIFLKKVEE